MYVAYNDGSPTNNWYGKSTRFCLGNIISKYYCNFYWFCYAGLMIYVEVFIIMYFFVSSGLMYEFI